jgi:methylthioribose-1-phosphate isomerase
LSLVYELENALNASQAPDFLASPAALKTHVDKTLAFLFTARPTAVNLGAATRRLQKTLDAAVSSGANARDIARQLIIEGIAINDEDLGRNKAMSTWGGNWLAERAGKEGTEGINVMTVCNTGSLATSVSVSLSFSPSC